MMAIRTYLGRCLFLIALTTVSVPVTAELNAWVLGSFRDKSNAEAEGRRLARLLDRNVDIYMAEERGLWRVVTDLRGLSREALVQAGLDAWRVSRSLGAVESIAKTIPPAVEKISEQPEQRAAQMAEAFVEVEPGETVVEWCDRMGRKAPKACDPAVLQQLQLLSERVMTASKRLSVACSDSDSEVGRQICDRWRSRGASVR